MTHDENARLERALTAVPPAAGTVVMGTGIVSIGLLLDGHQTLSRILFAAAALVWLALAAAFVGRLLNGPRGFSREARSPASLSAVAATAVLGTRVVMLGWSWAGSALLMIAVAVWIALLGPVLRHWVTPTQGVALMLTVSTESLAVLSAALAAAYHSDWLLYAALVPFLLGLAFYVFVISSFDARQLLVGHGDHWITGGALAISALAAGRVTLTVQSLHQLGGLTEGLKGLGIVLWALSIAWLPILIGGELVQPRWGYEARRWSTVFPVGMYAACSFELGIAAQAPALTDFARVWIWAAAALWMVVSGATLRHRLKPRFTRSSAPRRTVRR